MSKNRSEFGLSGSPDSQHEPASLAAKIGDPLREVRTLKRRVQVFVYIAILASEPFYYFVLDFTLVQLLPGMAIGLAIAFIAIEGAFHQMFRLRKRSAYPGVLHQELGTVAGENAAGDQALRVIAHLLAVEDGCIAIARSGEPQVKWVLSGSLEAHQDCIAGLKQPIAKAIRTGEPVDAAYPGPLPEGVKAPGIVVVPLVALQRTVGALILRADKGADLGDVQLLKDIGVALALSLANWGQREELQESEDRIKTVVTNVPVVLFAIDREGVFTLSEGKGLDDLDLKPGQVVGLNVADVYRDTPELLLDVQRALNGESFTDTLEVGGFWWETSYSPVLDEESGTVTGVIGVAANVTGRLRAENAVRESEELYRTLVETSPDAVLLISPEGMVVKANLRAAELLAFEDPSDMADLNARDFFSEEDLERVLAHIDRDGSAGGAGENEYTFLRRDGSTVPVEVILAALTDPDGNNVGYMGVARDITERKLADQALRQSEEKYRDLVENSNEIIYTLDRDAVVTYISPAVEPIGGFTPEEVIGRSSTEFIHPDDLGDVAMSLQKVLSGDEDPSEYRLLTKTGGYRWVRSASKPIYEGSEIVGVRGVLADITEKREAEDALRASEERFRALVENGADGIVLVSADGTIMYAGPSTESILGWTPDEMVGMRQSELIHPDDLESALALMSGLLEAPGETVQTVFRSKHKDGSWRWIESVGTNLLDEPSVGAIVGNYRDITEKRAAEDALRGSEERFRALVENGADGIFLIDADGAITYAGPSTERIKGFTPEETVGMQSSELVHPDDIDSVAALRSELLEAPGESMQLVYRSKHKDGSWRWIEAVATNLLEEPGVGAIVVNYRDITERKLADEALRRSEENHRALAVAVPDVMMRVRKNGTISDFKADEGHALSLAGTGSDEMVLAEVLPELAPQLMRFVDIAISTHETQVFEYQQTILGKPLEFEARIVASSDDEAVAIIRDITERKNSERTIRQLAYHDALTGLPNRALFEDRLKMAVAQARRAGEELAVMFLDLDRFKLVNDTLGHGAGDKLLSMVAEELTSLVRDGDTVARVGGDEFTLLLPKITGSAAAVEVAERILAKVKQPKRIAGQEFRVTTSLGITVFPSDGDDPETLLRNADTAMYRAKERGRDNHQLFTPAMNVSVVERLVLESDLRRALEREEFVVYYQAVASISSGQIVGAEALVRWNHPDRGLVMPDEFIPFAEETGLIVPLGEWVLKEAVVEAKRWIDAGLPELRVAVNLSARQLQDESLVEMVASTLKNSGLPPDRLQLEITEGAMMDNVESAIRVVKELRHLGLSFAVDDFGTGYSSLSYLKRFPIDTVKIDRSFVRDLTIDPNDAAIVTTVLAMARSLGLDVVAEGVETRKQLEFLREHDCDEFQGYLLSRPIPADEYVKLVSSAELARPRKRESRKLTPR